MSVLDVGCGNRATGDVNIDLFPKFSKHREGGKKINVKSIRNFVLADALTLPFANDSFDEVYSCEVIEHLPDPIRLMKECIRVASKKVTIIVPHRYAREGLKFHQPKAHISYFSVSWFHGVLKNFSHIVNCSTVGKPHRLFGLIQLPSLIKVEIYLNG